MLEHVGLERGHFAPIYHIPSMLQCKYWGWHRCSLSSVGEGCGSNEILPFRCFVHYIQEEVVRSSLHALMLEPTQIHKDKLISQLVSSEDVQF